MTPARLAEIRRYIERLDLDQLPPWTVEQAIIRDLWEALPEVWDEGLEAGVSYLTLAVHEPQASPTLDDLRCAGPHGCLRPPVFEIRNRDAIRRACGLHLGGLINHMITAGQSLGVMKLDGAS